MKSAPSAVTPNANEALELLDVRAGHTVWHTWQTSPEGAWSGWYSLGGSAA